MKAQGSTSATGAPPVPGGWDALILLAKYANVAFVFRSEVVSRPARPDPNVLQVGGGRVVRKRRGELERGAPIRESLGDAGEVSPLVAAMREKWSAGDHVGNIQRAFQGLPRIDYTSGSDADAARGKR